MYHVILYTPSGLDSNAERYGSQIHKSLYSITHFSNLICWWWVVGQFLHELCINNPILVLRTLKFSLPKSNKVYILVCFWIFCWQKYSFERLKKIALYGETVKRKSVSNIEFFCCFFWTLEHTIIVENYFKILSWIFFIVSEI